ncbi:hypothetical protein ACHAXS_002731 [Conticribra weissflogii]
MRIALYSFLAFLFGILVASFWVYCAVDSSKDLETSSIIEKNGESTYLTTPAEFHTEVGRFGTYVNLTPSFLEWNEAPVVIPPDWKFRTPESCLDRKRFDSASAANRNNKIIVHYHMQHNAGTSFYEWANEHFTDECATQCCYQKWKHCMVSFNEEIEAENIRNNYENHGVQYVSYELMLPPRFPLPFVGERAREGLFFTTIVRDPFKRFLTYMRRPMIKYHGNADDADSPFWTELSNKKKVYSPDNLNARWLSGALGKTLTPDHINVAKCRLQLFDLVITDTLFTQAVQQILCPLNNWTNGKYCGDDKTNQTKEYRPKPKSNNLEGTDPHFVGAWIERLRPSFEIYDYARLLSLKHMKKFKVQNLPQLSEVPSYMQVIATYANKTIDDNHFRRVPRLSIQNEDLFHPPKEFCDSMKKVWTSNPDEVPNVIGLGTIKYLEFHDMFF